MANITISSGSNTVNISAGSVITTKETYKIETFLGDDETINFATVNRFRTNSLTVMINGILQQRGVSYAEATNRQSITFTTAPKTGWKGELRYVVD